MQTKNKKPNIILINCDDLGWGDLSCYGSTMNKTPYLDRMADEGIRFTSFYMSSSVCSPSRGAMMTGCYAPRIGFDSFNGTLVLFPGFDCGLNPEETTIAGLLKGQGYSTKIIGKWHCGDQPEFLPTRHGFDSYYGLPYSNDMGRQKKREKNPPLPLMRDEKVIQEQPDQASLTERYVEEAVRYIRDNKDQPFFLYFAHMYVHLPLYAPERFLKESPNPYSAAVACIDWATGVLLDELKKNNIDENTLVVFTSDNGSRNDYGDSNGPLRGGKFTTWEGGMRLPCIMRWPNKIAPKQVNSEITTSLDFYTTFAHIAGAEVPEDRIIDGKDIQPLMYGEPDAKSPHEAFFYYQLNNLEAVRSGKWKLHFAKHEWGKKGPKAFEINELYDLENDMSEITNLYDKHPEIVKEIEKMANKMQEDIGDAWKGIKGKNVRPIGRVKNPKPLTHYDKSHPYIIALYDLPDGG